MRPDRDQRHGLGLTDPAILRDGDDIWLYYSIAGEQGIAVAELTIAGIND